MNTAESSFRVFPTERKVRLGVWGLGRGLHIISTAKAVNVEVVAGCDYNPHFLDKFRQAIPEGRFTADAEEFLSWDFDAVLIATYCPAHAHHAVQALKAGKHVLSEVTAFHTIGEAVMLIEAVEASGLIYQLAENYPYTPANRFLARKWCEGVFGNLMYGEYSYLHDCLNLAYTYIDGTPVEPGDQPHNWRSWLPWHYYNTHSLGPIIAITGERPARVTAFRGGPRLRGHLMESPSGLAGAAPSLLEMKSGAIVRNLMGGMTDDSSVQRLIGDRGASEIVKGSLHLRLGGRGHGPKFEVRPDDDEIGRLAAGSGHGGGDFWTLYHFANEILNGEKGGFDVFVAADMTLPGIQAYRSALEEGQPQEVPDLRDPAVREKWRSDDFAPARWGAGKSVFGSAEVSGAAKSFNAIMKDLLEAADLWETFMAWRTMDAYVANKMPILERGYELLDRIESVTTAVRLADEVRCAYPDTDGARVLGEVLERLDREAILAGDGTNRVQGAIDALIADLRPDSGLFPQLEMRREGMEDLPEIDLPEGYTVETYREGDDAAWRRIISASFDQDFDDEAFRRAMVYRADADLSRIHFIRAPDGETVATAAAYGGDELGYLHFVGVLPAHGGKHLGAIATVAALRAMRQRGCGAAWLRTDDWRFPAIKTYWRLGFRPSYDHRSDADRWRLLMAKLNLE